MTAHLTDGTVALPGGPRLAVRTAPGRLRPFVLVHGLASNALLWEGVGRRLASAGHAVVAVDQRGHGRSEEPPDGYDTPTCAADLAALIGELGFTGDRAPIVAGQSWGGNVVLTLAAEHGGVAGIALVDGGWIRLAERFPTFEECWAALAPPRFDGMPMARLRREVASWHPDWPPDSRGATLGNFVELPDGTARARLRREHHESIVRSLWELDPRELYPRVHVPALLVPAVGEEPSPADADKRAAVTEALLALPYASVEWYRGAHHDLHAQHPGRLAAHLLRLAARVGDSAEEAQ